MSRKLPVLFIFSVAVLASFVAFGPARRSNSASSSLSPALQATSQKAEHARILASYGKLPLSFEKNQGQTDDHVRFLAHGEGYALFLTSQEAVMRLDTPGPAKASQNTKKSTAVVRLAFAGSNQRSPVEGLDLQLGRSNYLLGNDPAKWHTGVPQYARVKYRGVYPGVDLIYYGNQGRLESDYVLAPGADSKQIALLVDGADSLKINLHGDLVLTTSAGEVLLHQPFAYQEVNGARQEIASNFVQRGPRTIGIQVASYDSTRPLVVDPVLDYSTLIGGSNNQDIGLGIAVDAAGNAYVTGSTGSLDFPTTSGAVQKSLNSATLAVFVTKLNKTATAPLVYSTYLGGSSGSNSVGNGIAVDSTGHAFVTGGTDAGGFPVTSGVIQGTNLAAGTSTAFLTELDPTGATLVYSTFLGGHGGETSNAIALDSTGIVYITGSTSSLDFPTNGTVAAFQTLNNSKAGGNAFLSRIDTTKTGSLGLLYSTYLGGSGSDSAFGIAVDSTANAFIAGTTNSTDFPHPTPANGFQTVITGSVGVAFVARLNTTVAGVPGLIYSSFLGGTTGGGTTTSNQAAGIALGANSEAVVVGTTNATDFPFTANALLKAKNNGVVRGFISLFDTTKSGAASLLTSTYFGGSTAGTTDKVTGVAADSLGNIYVTGITNSLDFPVTLGGPQPGEKGASNCAILSQLNPTATSVLFSTYWCGSPTGTRAHAIALDPTSSPSAYIAGVTDSTTFPTTPGVFQSTLKPNSANVFVAKFSPAAASGVFANPAQVAFGTVNVNSTSSPQTVSLINNTKSGVTGIAITFTGPNASDFSQQMAGSTCGTTLKAGANCTIDVVFTPTTSGSETATLNIAFTGASGSPQTVALSGTGSATTTPDFTLAVAPSSVTVTGGVTGTFTVTVTSQNSFASAVSLTCAGEPLNSTCTLTPASVTPPIAGKQTSTGSLTTVAMIPPSLPSFRRFPPVGVLGIIGLVLALLMARAAARRGARKLAWGFAFIGVLALAGCSGIPRTVGGGTGSTPKGTSTITITGASGALSHNTTFSFTVN